MWVWVKLPETFVAWLVSESDSSGSTSGAGSEPDAGAGSLLSGVDVESVGERWVRFESPNSVSGGSSERDLCFTATSAWDDVLVRGLGSASGSGWGLPLDLGLVDTSSKLVRLVVGDEAKVHTT